MSIINFGGLEKIIEEKGIINVDEYLKAVETARNDVNKQITALDEYTVNLLRSIKAIGDDDFYKSAENEIKKIDEELEQALNNLDLMENELNELQERSNNSDIKERWEELQKADTELDNTFSTLNDKFEGAPESIKGINKFNEQR